MLAVASPAVPALPSDTLLGGGRYRIEGEVGRGGYGITYRAQRLDDEAFVAIKECVLPGCTREGARIVAGEGATSDALWAWGERVLEQTQQLQRIEHPHLAKVFESWREGGTVYLAMELLDGPTLHAHVEAAGALSPEAALECAQELAGALEALHEVGLLHLDVKPENAILTERGAVLMDFDLVQTQGETDLRTRPLSMPSRVGTPGYAPPEAYGERAPQTPQSDIYSLGATLYFLLSGRTPPSSVDRAAGVTLEPLDLAPHLQDALNAALQLALDERPATLDAWQETWKAPPAPEDDYSFSAHQANFAQSQLREGVTRVVLTTAHPEWPPRCACCFQKADKDILLPVNSPSGKRFVPGCLLCVRHQRVAQSSANSLSHAMPVSLPMALLCIVLCVSTGGLGLGVSIGALSGLVGLLNYLFWLNYCGLKSSHAQEMLSSSCCHPLEPVTYNYNGRAYIWRFKNALYAEEFKKKNAAFVV